jgi:3-dehydroquinate dehydratase-2
MPPAPEKPVIGVIHGPNLNRLGEREPQIYGSSTLAEIDADLHERAVRLGVEIDAFQSNHEGELIDKIQQSADRWQGLIINPAAYTHTSIAIRDALAMLTIPVIEVHLSNIYRREPFRRHSLVSDVVTGQITGLGWYGYLAALDAIARLVDKPDTTGEEEE